jgi:hypothetical protein
MSFLFHIDNDLLILKVSSKHVLHNSYCSTNSRYVSQYEQRLSLLSLTWFTEMFSKGKMHTFISLSLSLSLFLSVYIETDIYIYLYINIYR